MSSTAQAEVLDKGAIVATVERGAIPVRCVLPGRATLGVSVVRYLTDCLVLFKVKIVAMVVLTSWGGAYLGALQSGGSTLRHGMLNGILGIGLISAGAGALNEVIEYRSDRLMRRTANRPVATGRIARLHGLLAGLIVLTLGVAWLLLRSNLLTMALSLLSAFIYVAVYTPVKRLTVLSTAVGALPGAMGPLLGWTATGGRLEWSALALFAILYVWQFPHFMSIAWLYREDYARAGFRMLPVVEPDGASTAAVALGFALLMFPVSQIPWMLGMTSSLYGLSAFALSLFYLFSTIQFLRIVNETSDKENRALARNLLRTSVVFLPILFSALMMCGKGRS
jgi:protoheme IX farnesyltransferase